MLNNNTSMIYQTVLHVTEAWGNITEAWGMRSADRRKVNVLEMKCLISLVGVS